MLPITVPHILYGNWDMLPDEPFCIYVIREEETVFYVGKSTDILNRLREHFSLSARGGYIGQFYQKNRSYAQDWRVELYTLADCQPLIGRDEKDLARAEIAMIQHFKPCLNGQNNLDPSPLPTKYKEIDLDDNTVDYIRL